MRSDAKTVTAYLSELPEDRRAAIRKVRAVIKKNLPKGFAETMSYGMIVYVVPHKLYPAGYHCDPKQALPYGGLASQKNYMSVYITTSGPGMEQWLRARFAEAGKKLDMGKGCIRFKKVEDLPLDVIGEAFGKISVADYILQYEDGLKLSKSRRAAK